MAAESRRLEGEKREFSFEIKSFLNKSDIYLMEVAAAAVEEVAEAVAAGHSPNPGDSPEDDDVGGAAEVVAAGGEENLWTPAASACPHHR